MASTVDAPAAEPGRIHALAQTYRLNLDARSAAGVIGLKEGRETGASVEIQDFRDYVPGDDPRRIDWMAYGRTNRLVVRLFREEVSPYFDVIVDASASMAIRDGRKGELARELCAWLYQSARLTGVPVRLFAAGAELNRLDEPNLLALDQPECIALVTPGRAVAALRRTSVRLLLTDFMAPAEPESVLRAFSASCGWFILVHVLGPWEADPRPEGPSVLHAVEDGRDADIQLDVKAVGAYRARLDALRTILRDEMFKCGGLYLPLVADCGLEDVLINSFLPAGLVETR